VSWVIGDPSCKVFTPWGEMMHGPADDSQEMRAVLHQVREQGPCVRCGHYACPHCGDWCDLLDCVCWEKYDDDECIFLFPGASCTQACGCWWARASTGEISHAPCAEHR